MSLTEEQLCNRESRQEGGVAWHSRSLVTDLTVIFAAFPQRVITPPGNFLLSLTYLSDSYFLLLGWLLLLLLIRSVGFLKICDICPHLFAFSPSEIVS